MRYKRALGLACLCSVLLIVAPAAGMVRGIVPDWFNEYLSWTTFTLLPGIFVSLMLSQNVHDYSRFIVIATSFLFWATLAFIVLNCLFRTREKQRA